MTAAGRKIGTEFGLSVSPVPPSSPAQPQWPPPLGSGSRVGIAALSSAVDPERLERGIARLRSWGYEPVLARNLRSRYHIFAGRDEERLAGFHELLRDDSVAAIWFARGGHGLLRVLPGIRWDLLGSRPRAFLGYSDLTPLLLEILRRFRWVTFHAPMVAAELARELLPEEEASLKAALEGRLEELRWPVVSEEGWDPNGLPLVLGSLVGGCLSLLVATLGTPYSWWRTQDQLLWFEEVREPFYRVDRMLTQLYLSGKLRRVRGVVVGHLDDDQGVDLAGSVVERLKGLLPGRPVWSGFPAGHRPPNCLVPLGWPVQYVPARGQLELYLGDEVETDRMARR